MESRVFLSLENHNPEESVGHQGLPFGLRVQDSQHLLSTHCVPRGGPSLPSNLELEDRQVTLAKSSVPQRVAGLQVSSEHLVHNGPYIQ